MEFTEVVRNRYSCKNFDAGKAVDAAKLTAVEIPREAGRVAPTAKNFQEQKILCDQSAEGLAKTRQGNAMPLHPPVWWWRLTVPMCSPTPAAVRTWCGDATIVATHTILTAANAGVDSCWVNFFDPEQLAKELGLPENEEILMIMHLGHAATGRCAAAEPWLPQAACGYGSISVIG